MGSGCINGGTQDSSFTLFQKLTPDTQVKYTGSAVPELRICTGDLLSEVEATIFQQILNFQKGQGITFSDIDLTQCGCFQEKVGCCGSVSCQTLECILQAYLDCMCSMYSDVQDLKGKVSQMYDGPYNVACLTGGGLSSSSKLPAIVQEVTKELCAANDAIAALNAKIAALTTSLPDSIGTALSKAVVGCNIASRVHGSGATFTVDLSGYAPKNSIVMISDVSNFNLGTGKGNPNTDACNWAIADGRNGTINMKGLIPIGTTDMVSTAPIGGAPAGLTNGNTYGVYTVALSAASIPTMSFSGSTPGVSGTIPFFKVSRQKAGTGDNTMSYQPDGSGTSTASGIPNGSFAFSAPGGSFSGSVGGGGSAPSHENVPPVRALYFIQRIS